VKKIGNHFAYTLMTTIGSQIFINDMDFSVSTMQYALKSQVCQLPNSSLVRNYAVAAIIDDSLFMGTTTGDLLIFSI
jgi:hypothetical protein